MLDGSQATTLGSLIVAWAAVFFVLRRLLFPRFTATFSNVVVSYIHACVAMGLAVQLSAVDWRHPFSGYGQPPTPAQMTVLSVSLAYFIYDAICCELIKHELANLLHHVATIVGLTVGVFHKVSGPELTACLILMEVSNPCLHSRAIFKELGWKDTFVADLNDVAFAITFFICRIVLGPFFVYFTLINPRSDLIVKCGGFSIQLVSAYWFWRIIQVIAYKSSKSKPRVK